MSDNKIAIPEEVEEEINSALTEEEVIGAFSNSGSGQEEKLSLIEKWFPGEDDIHGKTIISKNQAHAIAIGKHLPLVFNELDDEFGEFIKEIIDDYMMLLTSVEGIGREQQMNILAAMFGGISEDEDDARSWMKAAMAAGSADDDD